jgi:hypothetical protein
MPAPPDTGGPSLVVESYGTKGVNVDKNPFELDDSELVQSQNAISDPSSGKSTLRKRPGLAVFTLEETGGTVLGGINLPVQDLSPFGLHFIYLGRGPV